MSNIESRKFFGYELEGLVKDVVEKIKTGVISAEEVHEAKLFGNQTLEDVEIAIANLNEYQELLFCVKLTVLFCLRNKKKDALCANLQKKVFGIPH